VGRDQRVSWYRNRGFNITIRATSLGRNDSIATATPIGNGAIDPVIEIVNNSGTRLSTCALPGEVTFTSPCMHDDEDPGVLRDPLLRVQVGAGATIFLRVLDWRSDARPDATYNVHLSGVN
jgi:hypothetical protein